MTASSRAYITGFAFNIDSDDPSAQAWLMGGPAIYQGIHDARVPHFGLFESGAGLRGSVVGGGNPRNGIGAGETQVFTFEIKASDASRLTPESFLNGPLAHNFIVRFRGLGPDGMDLVPLQAAPVPGPSALTFLAVVTVLSRWRRRLAV